MKTLVLGPEEVREALNSSIFPRRQVFLVTLDGEIICCDLDEGWMTFKRPPNLLHREWAVAVRCAANALYQQAITARAIYNDLKERTEPAFLIESP